MHPRDEDPNKPHENSTGETPEDSTELAGAGDIPPPRRSPAQRPGTDPQPGHQQSVAPSSQDEPVYQSPPDSESGYFAGPPQGGGPPGGPGGGGDGGAWQPDHGQKVKVPAIIGLVIMGLSLLWQLGTFLWNLMISPEQRMRNAQEQVQQVFQMLESFSPGSVTPEMRDTYEQIMMSSADPLSLTNLAVTLLLLAATAFIAWGMWRMLQLRSWEMSVAASIMMLIPCFYPCCCCIGFPIGIWNLVLLTKAEVKDAFR